MVLNGIIKSDKSLVVLLYAGSYDKIKNGYSNLIKFRTNVVSYHRMRERRYKYVVIRKVFLNTRETLIFHIKSIKDSSDKSFIRDNILISSGNEEFDLVIELGNIVAFDKATS